MKSGEKVGESLVMLPFVPGQRVRIIDAGIEGSVIYVRWDSGSPTRVLVCVSWWNEGSYHECDFEKWMLEAVEEGP